MFTFFRRPSARVTTVVLGVTVVGVSAVAVAATAVTRNRKVPTTPTRDPFTHLRRPPVGDRDFEPTTTRVVADVDVTASDWFRTKLSGSATARSRRNRFENLDLEEILGGPLAVLFLGAGIAGAIAFWP